MPLNILRGFKIFSLCAAHPNHVRTSYFRIVLLYDGHFVLHKSSRMTLLPINKSENTEKSVLCTQYACVVSSALILSPIGSHRKIVRCLSTFFALYISWRSVDFNATVLPLWISVTSFLLTECWRKKLRCYIYLLYVGWLFTDSLTLLHIINNNYNWNDLHEFHIFIKKLQPTPKEGRHESKELKREPPWIKLY
jgi:hypothetical protein